MVGCWANEVLGYWGGGGIIEILELWREKIKIGGLGS